MRAHLALACSMLTLLSVTSVTWSHEWYPKDCCSGSDCYQIVPGKDVIETSQGYRILDSNEVIPYNQVRTSPDGNFHRCSNQAKRKWATLTSSTTHQICFWAPPPAT